MIAGRDMAAAGLRRAVAVIAVAAALLTAACAGEADLNGPGEMQRAAQRANRQFAALAKQGFSGSVVISRRSKILFERHHGSASAGTPIGPQTRFDIASVTKPVTAMAILKLAEQGKLALGDPLSRWFPAAPVDKRNITIRQLLAHSSGITDFVEWVRDYTPISKPEMASKLLKVELGFEPGSRWSYSNGGYNLLGQIIEAASGRDLESYLQSEIFAPAGVAASYDPTKFLAREVAGVSRDGQWRDVRQLANPANGSFWGLRGAGGVFVSARDLALLIDAFMAGKIFGPDSVRLATSPEIAEGMLSDSALGWVLIRRGSRDPVIYYSGGTLHASSAIRHYPDLDLTFVALSNKAEDSAARHANRKVAHAFLSLSAWNPFRPEG